MLSWRFRMAGVESTTSTHGHASEAAEPSLVIDGLTKRYGDRDAVSGVSLAVRPGSIHGLVGPNGSGKTTLLRAMAGDLGVDAGKIVVRNGIRVGWLPQQAVSGSTLPVWDEVAPFRSGRPDDETPPSS